MPIANFQNQVQQFPALGVPGDKATLNPFVYTDRNYLAGDAAVTVGNFVWDDPDNPVPPNYHGSGVLQALSSGEDGVLPLGIVQRNLSYINYNILDGGTLVVPENAPLQVVVKGDMYVVSTTAATKGQAVFATLADGSIQTGTAGATVTGTVTGAVETPWIVVDGGAAGELITISSWEA